MSEATRPSRLTTHRRPIIITLAVVAFVAIAAIVAVLILTSGGRSLGAIGEEVDGQTRTTTYSTAAEAPQKDIPSWMPRSSTSVTVEVPGPNSKSPGGIQVDAPVAAGFTLPASCQPAATSFPWVGWSSLNVPAAHIEQCSGWYATVSHQHLYTWKA